jgi:plasmid stabilization system protein ParE
MGHRRDDVRRGVRCLNSDGYMILYRYTAATVRIDRVVHHCRHLPAITFDDQT